MLRTPVGLALGAVVVLGVGTMGVAVLLAMRGISRACDTIGQTRR